MDDFSTVIGESTKPSEFASNTSVIRYKIHLNQTLVEKYADLMSKNEKLDLNEENVQHTKLLKKTTQLQLY